MFCVHWGRHRRRLNIDLTLDSGIVIFHLMDPGWWNGRAGQVLRLKPVCRCNTPRTNVDPVSHRLIQRWTTTCTGSVSSLQDLNPSGSVRVLLWQRAVRFWPQRTQPRCQGGVTRICTSMCATRGNIKIDRSPEPSHNDKRCESFTRS